MPEERNSTANPVADRRRELQHMLFRRKKAELEILSSAGEWALCNYLVSKIRAALAEQ